MLVNSLEYVNTSFLEETQYESFFDFTASPSSKTTKKCKKSRVKSQI